YSFLAPVSAIVASTVAIATQGETYACLHLLNLRHAISGERRSTGSLPGVQGRTPIYSPRGAVVDNAGAASDFPSQRIPSVRTGPDRHRHRAQICHRPARTSVVHA